MNGAEARKTSRWSGKTLGAVLTVAVLVLGCGAGEEADEPAGTPEIEPGEAPEAEESEAGEAQEDGEGPAAADDFQQVDFIAINNLYHVPAFIALEQGYWAQYGLDVNLTVVTSGRDVTTALQAGEADLGGANMGTTTASARAGGNLLTGVVPYVNAADHVAFAGGRGIIARADSGIDADDPSTMLGTTIGYLEGSTQDVYLRQYFAEHGLDIDDVELLNIPVPDMPISITDGLVDAVVPWEPYNSQIVRELGDNAVEVSRDAPGYVADVIGVLTHEDFVADNEELLEPFIAGIVEGMQFLRQNPEEAAMIATSYIDGLNPDDAAEGFTHISYDPRVSVCTEEGLVKTAENMVNDGLIELDEMLTIDEIANTSILERVLADNPQLIDDLPDVPDDVSDCLGQLD